MIYNGTSGNDYIVIENQFDQVNGRAGDDRFVFESENDCVIDGGFGFDVFEMQLFSYQDVVFNEINSEKTIIKVYDAETDDLIQKIVLWDIEQIDVFAVG